MSVTAAEHRRRRRQLMELAGHGAIIIVPSAPGQGARIFLLRAGTGGAAPTWAAGFPVSFAWPVSGVAKRDAAGTQMAAWSTRLVTEVKGRLVLMGVQVCKLVDA